MRKLTSAIIIALSLITITVAYEETQVEPAYPDQRSYRMLWADWSRTFHQSFGSREMPMRYQIFKSTVDRIHTHNKYTASYKLKLNQFAALMDDEWRSIYGHDIQSSTSVPVNPPSSHRHIMPQTAPSEWNWLDYSAVGPVDDEKTCGCSYAFSANGAIESNGKIFGGLLILLSEQEILDCTAAYGNSGCSGGSMDNCFTYAIAKHGMASQAGYPYKAKVISCLTKPRVSYSHIETFTTVTANDPPALVEAIYQQPVSVGVDGDDYNFRFYSSGLYNDSECSTSANHAMLAVGYGGTGANAYWLLQNSWGIGWGDSGYMSLYRNTLETDGPGWCGVATMPSYPSY